MANLEQFAQDARRQLREQVAARLEQVLRIDSVEIREKEKAVAELQGQIARASQEAVIEKVAYTWFNRLCALRFMDVNHYTRVGIVSPVAGFTQPELLHEAKQGVIDDTIPLDRQRVFDLLGGQTPAAHPQREAYRLLLVGACNAYHHMMPFLFEEIEDYSELLMPGDLLSENSILQAIRDTLAEEACRDVEVIGWLYQYYISERKDEVFARLRQNQKIQPEDIPAATQLFTPHWIVRYLVENSLGRLWLLNRPKSRLAEVMDYYIRPEQAETDFLRLSSPEEIKVCDPACGSGHMLTYAFDLLYQIYEEEGYDPVQIPRLILEKNLYGIEIDLRAGHLAAFALTMKAREKDRRFFRRGVTPSICVLENVQFTADEIEAYMDAVGRDLFTQDLQFLLTQFEAANTCGSLIRPRVTDINTIRERLAEQGIFENLFLHATNQKVQQVLAQAEYLSPRYQVVVANPPYMGGKGMNAEVRDFARDQYPDSKSDTCAMFIERNLEMVRPRGLIGMITMQSWMFLSSFEDLRTRMLAEHTILSMAHLGTQAFDTIGGAVVSTTAFVIDGARRPEHKGTYLRLVHGEGEEKKSDSLLANIPATGQPLPANCYHVSAADFKKIPGSPIAYWVSDWVRGVFSNHDPLSDLSTIRVGLQTGENDRFVRLWHEVPQRGTGFGCGSREEALKSTRKWFPYNKGGQYRKWYGNRDFVVNWEDDGREIRGFGDSDGRPRSRAQNTQFYFWSSISWSKISSGNLAMRYFPTGFIFDVAGCSIFAEDRSFLLNLLGYSNTVLVRQMLAAISPTLNFEVGHIANLPIVKTSDTQQTRLVEELIDYARADWDFSETSWDFTRLPLLRPEHRHETLTGTYAALRAHWQGMTEEMQRLEEENNRIWIEACDLQEELTPEVPLAEITLTCNPHYRYGGSRSDEELEALQLADTMKEFVSYAVGCMFGRYSLDKPGLILASQGQTAEDYRAQIPDPTFPPDEDNVIPILDEGWFSDGITERFKRFLRLTFGDQHYEDNLDFLEAAIGKDIRSYFLKDFYKDHLKTYKKRPIYWLFSSPRGSFNALVYMHRYRPDTVSVVLNDYLRQFRVKLSAHKAHLEQVSITGEPREKTRALKALDQVNKILAELKEYEDEILYPLATQRVEIGLDDGVKVNYPKFGNALKKI